VEGLIHLKEAPFWLVLGKSQIEAVLESHSLVDWTAAPDLKILALTHTGLATLE